MHVADIFSLSPSSDHFVLSTYYMLYWTWHGHFKKHLRLKSRYLTASLFFKSWLCLCRYCLLNLNMTSPLFLEQLVYHITTTEIPFHLCEKTKHTHTHTKTQTKNTTHQNPKQDPCVSQKKTQPTHWKHFLHRVHLLEWWEFKYLILKCSLDYLISAVISITHQEIMETSKFVFLVFCNKYCSQRYYFMYREMREGVSLVMWVVYKRQNFWSGMKLWCVCKLMQSSQSSSKTLGLWEYS